MQYDDFHWLRVAVAVAATAAAPPSRFRPDQRIRAANRTFVSGMGLQAEWQTDMRITGTTANPVVVGKLHRPRHLFFRGQALRADRRWRDHLRLRSAHQPAAVAERQHHVR